jgi:hypothetical protein
MVELVMFLILIVIRSSNDDVARIEANQFCGASFSLSHPVIRIVMEHRLKIRDRGTRNESKITHTRVIDKCPVC